MWLDAFGLQDVEDEARRNTGIWAPDAGPCDAKKSGKPCKLPSKMWARTEREKVMLS